MYEVLGKKGHSQNLNMEETPTPLNLEKDTDDQLVQLVEETKKLSVIHEGEEEEEKTEDPKEEEEDPVSTLLNTCQKLLEQNNQIMNMCNNLTTAHNILKQRFDDYKADMELKITDIEHDLRKTCDGIINFNSDQKGNYNHISARIEELETDKDMLYGMVKSLQDKIEGNN